MIGGDLVVGEGAVLVDGVDSGDTRSDGFSLEHRFLFPFGEERNVVVDVLQDDVHRRFAGQLLHSVILTGEKTQVFIGERSGWQRSPVTSSAEDLITRLQIFKL